MKSTTVFATGTSIMISALCAADSTEIVYDNTDGFTGIGFAHGADTVWDDLTLAPGSRLLDNFIFSVTNFSDLSLLSVEVIVSFAADVSPEDSIANGPATDVIELNLGEVNLNLGDGQTTLHQVSLAPNDRFLLPNGVDERVWMGVTFSNAILSNQDELGIVPEEDAASVGQGLYDPVVTGSSTDTAFQGEPGSGSLFTDFSGDSGRNLNFGNQLGTLAIPLPPAAYGALPLLGLLWFADARRRRRDRRTD